MKVLLITTEIWSDKNPEGIVARKILHGLVENNVSVDVITTKNFDDKNVNNVLVIRNESNETIEKLQKRIFGIEKNKFVHSCIDAINNKVLDIEEYDIVITRSEPFYLHKIGLFIKEKYPNLFWCSSFGDPVFCNPYNSNLFKKIYAKKFELKIWKCADIVTHTNLAAIDEYRAKGFKYFTNYYILPNPFCSKEIIELTSNNKKEKKRDVTNFVFIGSLYGKRNISPLLESLKEFRGNFMVYLVGAVRNVYYENRFGFFNKFLYKKDLSSIKRDISKHNMEDKVKILPFMSKEKLDIFIKNNADVLVNIDANVGNKNIFLSSKIVEYLKYKKPIANFSIPGASVDFMRSVGVDYYIDISKKPKQITKYKIQHNMMPDIEKIEAYSSKNIVKNLLEKINDNHRFTNIQ